LKISIFVKFITHNTIDYLKPNLKYKNSYFFLSLIFTLVILLGAVSCSTTKYVGDKEYLLSKVSVKVDDKNISSTELNQNIKQKPNIKILGVWKFHLGLYNLSGKNTKKGINKWLRRIGEEPVIYEDYQTQRGKTQLEIYLKKKGYYNAIIEDTVIFRRKKAKLKFNIIAGTPYKYSNVYDEEADLPRNFLSPYQKRKEISDTSLIRRYLVADSVNRNIKPGQNVDSDNLGKERDRISKVIKNKGYYNFSKEYVHFMMDSVGKDHHMDVFVGIKKPLSLNVERKYRIRTIVVNTDYNPKSVLMNDSLYINKLDTLTYDNCQFIYNKKLNIKPDVILNSLSFQPGSLYNLSNVEESYTKLQALSQYKFVNIRFEVDAEAENQTEGSLNCIIQLTPHKKQAYTVEVEGTNTSGNIGFAAKLHYQHRNLLRGAEILDISLSNATETVKSNNSGNFFSREYGGEVSLSTPKFLLPFLNANRFKRRYNPKTRLSMAYDYQKRPDYTRTQADVSFGYNWKSSRYLSHSLSLLELSFVDVKNLSDDFLKNINNLYIANSFTEHVISTTRYTLTYNNQNLNKPSNYNYLRFSFETAGNTLKTLDQLFGSKKNEDYNDAGELEGTYYDLLGIRYAQYIKMDVDYRYNWHLNKVNTIVGRLFLGLGYAYGNLEVLPFEKSYFSGGANGIRAWQVRSLGPGSFSNDQAAYPNNTADLKLEGNLEYRFKLIWALEGALFLDAGNIWAVSSKDGREGAEFEMNRFYKEIAVGTGVGARVDLNFILFRLDLGLKLRDPSLPADQRWIIGNRPFNVSQLTYNIGIGYPF